MTTNRLSLLSEKTPLKGTGILVTAHPTRRRSRAQALRCAVQGLVDTWQSEPNFRVHICVAAAMVILGLWCGLSLIEWLWIAFAIGLVIFAELMNTAIEQTVDLVVGLRPDPLARRVKDVAAACVLTAAVLAVVIGTLTFLPHLVGR